MSSTRAPRRHHDFTLLWVGQTVSELGNEVSLFVFPFVTLALGGSALQAGLVQAVHLLGTVVALLPAGVLADRVDRRLLLRGASATGAVLYAGLAVAAVAGVLTLPHLVAVAALSGVAAGVFAPAEMSAVRSVVARSALPGALSRNQARQHVASLVGGPLGAVLYGVTRWLPFAVDAATYAVSWVLLGRLRTDLAAPVHDGPRRSATAELREGMAYVWHHPLFRVLTAWSCLTNLVINALFTVAMLQLVRDGVDPWQIGLVSTAAGAAGILGAVLAPWLVERVPTGRLTIAVAWSPVPLVVPMALWDHPAVVAAGLCCVLLVNPAGNAGMGAYRLTVTPPLLVGRVQGASQFVAMLAMPLAPLLAGVLLTGLGGGAAVLVTGVLCGLVALVPTTSRAVRAVPRPAGWETAAPLPVAVATRT